MRLAAPAASLLVAAFALAGCTAPSDDHGGGDAHPLASDTYRMRLAGMPSGPVGAGHAFDVTVHAEPGAGLGETHRTTDHIGAHFWNRTMADPTAGIGNSTACAHTAGELPGTYTAKCTAPAQPGTYHVRAHARVVENGTTHHWWGDEHTFTVG